MKELFLPNYNGSTHRRKRAATHGREVYDSAGCEHYGLSLAVTSVSWPLSNQHTYFYLFILIILYLQEVMKYINKTVTGEYSKLNKEHFYRNLRAIFLFSVVILFLQSRAAPHFPSCVALWENGLHQRTVLIILDLGTFILSCWML